MIEEHREILIKARQITHPSHHVLPSHEITTLAEEALEAFAFVLVSMSFLSK